MLLTLLSLLLLFLPLGDSVTPRQEKKIIKIAQKFWQERPLEIEQISLNDAAGQSIEGYYYTVSTESRLIGYLAGKRILDNYLNYFPVFLMDTNYVILQAAIVEMNTIRGAEISARSWLKQFSGFAGEPIRYGKDINAITGATLSGLSVVKEVQLVRANLMNGLITKIGTILGQ